MFDAEATRRVCRWDEYCLSSNIKYDEMTALDSNFNQAIVMYLTAVLAQKVCQKVFRFRPQ
jgi:hypothetical protein